MGAIISSVVIVFVMIGLFRKYRPLHEQSVGQTLLLHLILGYFAVATPTGIIMGGLFVGYFHGDHDIHVLLLSWLYSSLGFLLLLIPSLKISRQQLYSLSLPDYHRDSASFNRRCGIGAVRQPILTSSIIIDSRLNR